MFYLKSTLFFGYHKASVDKLLQELTQEKDELKNRITKQEKIINELTAQLTLQKNKENLISDILLESKQTAHETLAQTKEQAEIYMSNIYERLDRNITEVQEKTTLLENLNQQLIGFEQKMKRELRDALEKQLEALENIDLDAYELSKSDASTVVENSHIAVENARKIIEFPEKKNDNLDNPEELPVFMIGN